MKATTTISGFITLSGVLLRGVCTCFLPTGESFVVQQQSAPTSLIRQHGSSYSNPFALKANANINDVDDDNNLWDSSKDLGRSRRRFLHQIPVQLGGLLAGVSVSSSFILGLPSESANAVTMEKARQPMTEDEAVEKFKEGYKSITYLLDNYKQVTENGGGDNVRRYLGTIVTTPPSGMLGIGKVMKALEERADDFVEYTELSEELIKSVNQADGSAYMAIFVSSSSSSTPPSQYFSDAKVEIKRCAKTMQQIAAMVDIKL
jgi:hypothetical protein